MGFLGQGIIGGEMMTVVDCLVTGLRLEAVSSEGVELRIFFHDISCYFHDVARLSSSVA